jgi:hypothetical protein
MIPATLKVYVNKSGVSNGAAEKSVRGNYFIFADSNCS